MPLDSVREEKTVLNKFYRKVFFASLLCFELIILGSVVRVYDAGLACPDWPLCYGQLIPAMDFQIFIEWFHRLTALLLGLFLFWTLVYLIKYRFLRRSFAYPLYGAIGLFLWQCILGGLTVLDLLDPKIVSLHLLNALLFLSVLVWLTYTVRMRLNREALFLKPENVSLKPYRITMAVSVFLILAQIALGGAVSTSHAGLVCPDFPTCHGTWIPGDSHLLWLQMSHRYLAFALLGLFIWMAFSFDRLRDHWCRNLAMTYPVLATLQIGLGVLNITLEIPKWASVLHLSNAVVLFLFSVLGLLRLLTLKSVYSAPVSSAKSHSKVSKYVNEYN